MKFKEKYVSKTQSQRTFLKRSTELAFIAQHYNSMLEAEVENYQS